MSCSSCSLKITIGIPTFDDYDGAIFTLQNARLNGGLPHGQLDCIILDNNPKGRDGERLRRFCETAQVRYIPYDDVQGTAAPRDVIFSNAVGEVVVIVDSHVLIAAGSLLKLGQFAAANPGNLDLWHGPWIADHMGLPLCVGMRPEWGTDGMFGVWQYGDVNPQGPPIEIPMHGLGLMACRREAWIGQPHGLRGFGGCEGYLHEQFRKAGRRVLLLPFLLWWHRFRLSGEPMPYRNDYLDRCRNYLIWALSLDMPIDEIHRQMVGGGKVTTEQLDGLLEEARALTAPDRKLPSLFQRAANLAGAIGRAVATRGQTVTPEQHAARLEVCRVCEHRAGGHCTLCGCHLQAKSLLAAEQCPDNRWPASPDTVSDPA